MFVLEAASVQHVDEFTTVLRPQRTPVFRRTIGKRQHGSQSSIHMNRLRSKHRPPVAEPHVDKRKTEFRNKPLRRMIRRVIPAPDEEKDDDDDEGVGQHEKHSQSAFKGTYDNSTRKNEGLSFSGIPLQDGVMFCHRIYYSLSTAEAFLRFASRSFVRPAMYSATGSVARIFSQRWTSRRAAAIDSP